MLTVRQIESVLAHWPIAQGTRPIIESVPQGLSGAFVARVKLPPDSCALPNSKVLLDSSTPLGQRSQPTHRWALKAWPPGTSAGRVATIHEMVRKASQRCSLLCPAEPAVEGESIVVAMGRVWELSPWVHGRPLEAEADCDMIASAGQAIAKTHEALAGDQGISTSEPTPSVLRRWNRLGELDRVLPRLLCDAPALDSIFPLLNAQITPPGGASQTQLRRLAESLWSAMEVLRQSWGRHVGPIRESLRQFEHQSTVFPIQTVLRDVHREHLLFDPDTQTASGIIDYDALGQDSPAADLARYAGSFDRPTAEVLEALTAGYRLIRPLSKGEIELTRCLIQANAIGGLANWVVWLVLDKRCFACEPFVIQGRISHLIASNCRIW